MFRVLLMLKAEQLGLFAARATVESHVRKTSSGKLSHVRQHQREVKRAPEKHRVIVRAEAAAPPEPDTGPKDYWVPAYKVAGLRAKITEWQRRAHRLKMPPPTFEKTDQRKTRRVTIPGTNGMPDTDMDVDFVMVRVGGPELKIAGDWRLRAVADIAEGGNILRAMPGVQLPHKYRHSSDHCDHCGTNRSRKQLFVIQSASHGWKQVGASCLGDFMGRSATSAAAAAQYLDDLNQWLKDGEEDTWGSGSGGEHNGKATLLRVMLLAQYAVDRWGYISGATAKDTGQGSTASDVRNLLRPGEAAKVRAALEDTDRRSRVAAVIKWAASLTDKEVEGSSYLHNIRLIAKSGAVDLDRHLGIAVSMIGAHQSATAAPPADAFKGNKGDKIGRKLSAKDKRDGKQGFPPIEMECTGRSMYTGTFGDTYRLTFRDDDGFVYQWKTASPGYKDHDGPKVHENGLTNGAIMPGMRVRMVATISGHDEYRGEKKTMLTRAAPHLVFSDKDKAALARHKAESWAELRSGERFKERPDDDDWVSSDAFHKWLRSKGA